MDPLVFADPHESVENRRHVILGEPCFGVWSAVQMMRDLPGHDWAMTLKIHHRRAHFVGIAHNTES